MYKLDYSVFSLKQKDLSLLEQISSNEIDKSVNTFLDKFGKIIVVFYQLRRSEDELLLVFPSSFEERLKDYLSPYLKLSKAAFEKQDYFVYFSFKKQGELFIGLEQGGFFLTKEKQEETIDKQTFDLFRLEHHIPLQGVDFDQEMVLNVSLDFASSKKGCYPGQEIVARVLSRSKPPQALIVKYLDECSNDEVLTSKTKDPKTGREKGFVFVSKS